MTVTDSEFPLGYFYIVSKMNDLVIDLRGPETATVSLIYTLYKNIKKVYMSLILRFTILF